MLDTLFNFFGKKIRSSVEEDAAGLVDKECNYCPQCGDEYRDSVRRCASCMVDLIPGSEKMKQVQRDTRYKYSRSLDIIETDDLVVLIEAKLHDVKAVRNLLAKERVPSLIFAEGRSRG